MTPGPRRPLLRRLALVPLAALLAVLLAELAFRAFESRLVPQPERFARMRDYIVHGHPGDFEPRPHTVYAHPRSTANTNAHGFRDREWPVERSAGVGRILCLGSSTTEGAYPPLLEALLQERAGRPFEVMSGAMPGWTTAELVVAWFLLFQDYRPDLVVIHEGINDVFPRLREDFRPDYTHWRRNWTPPEAGLLRRLLVRSSHLWSWLTLWRQPPNIMQFTAVPPGPRRTPPGTTLPAATSAAFRRNIESIGQHATLQGARVMLMTMPIRVPTEQEWQDDVLCYYGVAEHNQILRELALQHGWLLADAAELFGQRADLGREVFQDLVHLLEPGNRAKARLVLDTLSAGWGEYLR